MAGNPKEAEVECHGSAAGTQRVAMYPFFFTLVTGPVRSLSLKLSDTRVYEPHTRARLGTETHLPCAMVVKYGGGSFLQERAVRERNRDPIRTTTRAGALRP